MPISGTNKILLTIVLLFCAFFLMWIHRAYSDIAWLDQDNLLAGNMNNFYNHTYSFQDFYYRPPFLNCISLLETYLNCRLFAYNTLIETTLSAILLASMAYYFIRSEVSLFPGWTKYVFAVMCCLIVFGLQKWQNVLWSTGWGATLCVFLGLITVNIVHRYYLNRLRSPFTNKYFIPVYIGLSVLANLEFSAYYMPFQASLLLLMLINYYLFRDKLDIRKWRVALLLTICLLIFALSINFLAQSYSIKHPGYDVYAKASISASIGDGKLLNIIKNPKYIAKFYLWANTGNLLDAESYEDPGLRRLMPLAGLLVLFFYAYCIYVFFRTKKVEFIYSISLILYTLVLYATITLGRQGSGDVVYGSSSRYAGASFSGMLGLCTLFSLFFLSFRHLSFFKRSLYLVPVLLVCICYFISDQSQWHLAPWRKIAYTRMSENLKANRNLELLECPESVVKARKMMIDNRLNAFKPGARLNNFSVNYDLQNVTSIGFYDEENSPNGKYRWTNGSAEIYLPNLFSDKDSIKLKLFYYLPRPDTPMVKLNDSLYPSRLVRFDQGYEYTFPAGGKKVIFKATISNTSYVPHLVNKDLSDSRTLGLVFNSMSFYE